ncbi:hypothetical protein H6G36_30055 [Anabaena minutissima FACHB-250]|nr:hypothetical protein [Anabaena minutissima FACHB-250]
MKTKRSCSKTSKNISINGEIVALAKKNKLYAPINSKITTLIKEAETQGGGSPKMSTIEMAKRLGISV